MREVERSGHSSDCSDSPSYVHSLMSTGEKFLPLCALTFTYLMENDYQEAQSKEYTPLMRPNLQTLLSAFRVDFTSAKCAYRETSLKPRINF